MHLCESHSDTYIFEKEQFLDATVPIVHVNETLKGIVLFVNITALAHITHISPKKQLLSSFTFSKLVLKPRQNSVSYCFQLLHPALVLWCIFAVLLHLGFLFFFFFSCYSICRFVYINTFFKIFISGTCELHFLLIELHILSQISCLAKLGQQS